MWGWCCSVFNFLCNVLQIIVCFFFFQHVLSVLLRFMDSDYLFWYLQILLIDFYRVKINKYKHYNYQRYNVEQCKYIVNFSKKYFVFITKTLDSRTSFIRQTDQQHRNQSRGRYSWLMSLTIWSYVVHFCILPCVFRELTITHLYFPWANELC